MAASEDEIDAAKNSVIATLKHPLIREAARQSSAHVFRELPVAVKLDDGTLAEGAADLVFLSAQNAESENWIVVDVKTDYEFGVRLSEYEAQVSLYALAVSRATGQHAGAILLKGTSKNSPFSGVVDLESG